MIRVETTEGGICVTIPDGEVSPERVSALLDWLDLESVARRSSLREDAADQLAEEIKAGWWASNKHRFIVRPEQ